MEWEPLGPIGPRLAFHVGCLIRGSLYIHGGVREKDGKQPSSDLYRMDVTSGTWSEVCIVTPKFCCMVCHMHLKRIFYRKDSLERESS